MNGIWSFKNMQLLIFRLNCCGTNTAFNTKLCTQLAGDSELLPLLDKQFKTEAYYKSGL